MGNNWVRCFSQTITMSKGFVATAANRRFLEVLPHFFEAINALSPLLEKDINFIQYDADMAELRLDSHEESLASVTFLASSDDSVTHKAFMQLFQEALDKWVWD